MSPNNSGITSETASDTTAYDFLLYFVVLVWLGVMVGVWFDLSFFLTGSGELTVSGWLSLV